MVFDDIKSFIQYIQDKEDIVKIKNKAYQNGVLIASWKKPVKNTKL